LQRSLEHRGEVIIFGHTPPVYSPKRLGPNASIERLPIANRGTHRVIAHWANATFLECDIG
jgi:hypothetical protein